MGHLVEKEWDIMWERSGTLCEALVENSCTLGEKMMRVGIIKKFYKFIRKYNLFILKKLIYCD